MTIALIERLAILLQRAARQQAKLTQLPTHVRSNRLSDGAEVQPTLILYTMAYTDG